ncbi:hypothetical protein T4A_7042 [Trichinella pseudospiralis]|uniref:Uncharacterized protein n=1 Tax=Trichinella pseudospiralis TaxID=6337 RepID=A0A0V1EQ93_TRIPS|nr:hypothetical protein T4A_7042 [Trichinella pseudospiralis]
MPPFDVILNSDATTCYVTNQTSAQFLIIMHQYGDRYLHNKALEINFWRFKISQGLLLIGHFIFVICFPMCALLIGLRDMQNN